MLKLNREKLDARWGKRLADIASQFLLLANVKPKNLDAEKKDFLSGKIENPHFKYETDPKLKVYLKLIDVFLSDLKNEKNRIIKKLYADRLLELKMQIELVQAIGINDEQVSKISESLFGKPNTDDILKAQKIFKARKKIKSRNFDATTIKKVFEKALSHYHLRHWNVVIDQKFSLAITVSVINEGQYSPRIIIPYSHRVSKIRLQQLVAHEIETHVLRQQNGWNSNLSILSMPLGCKNFLTCEEGLAVLNGKCRFPKTGSEALSILAFHLSKNLNFRETFEKLKSKGIKKDLAWRRTARIFRGITDCQNTHNFRFWYDNIYWQGLKKVTNNLHQHPQNFKNLYCGKTNLEDLDSILNLAENTKIKLLPENLEVEQLLSRI